MKIQQFILLAFLAAPFTMGLDFAANIRGGLVENTKSVNADSVMDDVRRDLGSSSSSEESSEDSSEDSSEHSSSSSGKSKVSFAIMSVLSLSVSL